MNLSILDKIGDKNPQLFRELKGRLKTRNLAIAGALSLVGQFILWMVFQSQLPAELSTQSKWIPKSRYCTGEYAHSNRYKCLEDAFGHWIVDWDKWWYDLGLVLSLIMLATLILGGIYLLISDLAKEEERGTLNFIRLSPQSSQSLLIGKLLGVPALVYLAVALAFPLQWVSTIAGGVSISTVFSFYILALASCGVFYTAALLFTLLGARQGWLGCAIASLLGWPFAGILALLFEKNSDWLLSQFQWFFIPIGRSQMATQGFFLVNLLLWTFWFWKVVNRRFRNPNTTILSKKQSYAITTCIELTLVGFALPLVEEIKYQDAFEGWLFAFSTLNLVFFLVLVAALSPQRQALQDWARYRTVQKQGRSIVRELVWGEKSPAVVAIAINLAITALIWLPWVLLWPWEVEKSAAFVGLFLAGNLIWIYAAIVQLMLMMKTRKRVGLTAGTLGAILTLSPVLLLVLSNEPTKFAGLWIFSVFGAGLFASTHTSVMTLALSFLGQLSAMAWLGLRLTRTLQKAGESESKALLGDRRALPSTR